MKLNLQSRIFVGFTAVLLVLVVVFSVSYLSTPRPVLAAEEMKAPDAKALETHTINVVGEGKISVTPDVAYLSIGLSTKAATAKEAQSKNAEGFINVQKVLFDTYKLDKKDVVTSGFQVQPNYTYTKNDEPKITSYSANQTIQITYRDLAKIGILLDDLSAAGVNQMNGIQFDTEKRQEYEIQAIDNAMSNAALKAKAIAKNAGKELKGVINVVQGGASAMPININRGMMDTMKLASSESIATSISAGELKIITTITVQYEF
ncbi:DUF541 domain-containing protein [Paenibacillus psychroresistens]|uniref:DUF541 domain-containing protein n=1 Tax=Paenibacillus psychroresistens TaxID=1778678 RepID=A0A6B8RUU7_9BACL|nr:SIMPL domain-containing protein [Paenibacillus psychroresistens]QGQ99066.1 DUF541 domain-containing protein [Paenibacillus psychroresistens]